MNSNRELQDKIEKLVRELVDAHIEETRTAVAAAVTRALGASAMTKPVSAAKKRKQQQQQQQQQARKAGRRRPPEEVAALAERLHAQVCAQPGAAMVAFATELGATARELHRPMMTLKRAGRVRSVGERHRTRYFPAVAPEANLRSA